MSISPRLRHVALNLVTASSMAALLLSCQTADTGDHGTSPESARLALFQDAMRRVERSYVEPVSGDKLMTDALKGALNGLDPHSDYMDEREYRAMLRDTQGEFGGLGMELTMDHGMPKIISPIEDTPAAHAGVRPGDLIPTIDGQSTEKMSLRVGNVVQRAQLAPKRQMWCRSALPWASDLGGLPGAEREWQAPATPKA